MAENERESKLKPKEVLKELSAEECAELESKNALRQFDLLQQLIIDGLAKDPYALNFFFGGG